MIISKATFKIFYQMKKIWKLFPTNNQLLPRDLSLLKGYFLNLDGDNIFNYLIQILLIQSIIGKSQLNNLKCCPHLSSENNFSANLDLFVKIDYWL